MSELVKRTLSGLIFVGCIVGCVLWSRLSVAVLILLICLLAVDEFHRLVQSHILQRVFAALGVVVLWLTGLYYDQPFVFAFVAAYLPIMLTAMLDEIWNHSGKPLQTRGNMLISQLMIALPLMSLLLLYDLDKWLLLALFVLIWVNDTGAYCVGSLTAKRPQGNHKMAPHVSPKKSWEGLIGGVVFTLAAAMVLYQYGWFDGLHAEHNGWSLALLFGLLTSVFGTLGDLMESLFKRSIGVKDSGRFLPGHGGVLDRFDSILLAAPVLTVICWLCYFIVPLL